MWCAAFFAVLACISAPAAFMSGNVITIISWVTQSFLQLVLLPVILIAQNIEGKHSELQAEMDYEVDIETIELLKRIDRKLDDHISDKK
jgi:hypothetical protein